MTPIAVDFGSAFQASNEAISTARNIVCSGVEAVQGASRAMLPLPLRLWHIAWKLKASVDSVQGLNDKVRMYYVLSGSIPYGLDITPMATNVSGLVEAIERLYAIARKRGLTNQTLTAASLNRIRSYGDEIFDKTETLALILDPRTKESFKAAREEYERGETVGIEIFS
jgi:hypothetical protein